MGEAYLSTRFGADLDRIGFKRTRKIAGAQLDALQAALVDVAEGESDAVLDASARIYVRAMSERASGSPPRAPDFDEVVQGMTWLADPAHPETVARAFDTSGDVPPAGLLCLGECKSGEIWVLDVAIKHGYVFMIDENRKLVPMFRGVAEFAQWAVANELWKRRLAREGELDERLGRLHFFKTVAWLRDNGLVPSGFAPKRFKPLHDLPTAMAKNER
jgi:hypothetical protein